MPTWAALFASAALCLFTGIPISIWQAGTPKSTARRMRPLMWSLFVLAFTFTAAGIWTAVVW